MNTGNVRYALACRDLDKRQIEKLKFVRKVDHACSAGHDKLKHIGHS